MLRSIITLLVILGAAGIAMADVCVDCHTDITPGAVSDWKLSKHFENDVSCDVNPDYALWHGWSEMVRDLSDIKVMASDLRTDY